MSCFWLMSVRSLRRKRTSLFTQSQNTAAETCRKDSEGLYCIVSEEGIVQPRVVWLDEAYRKKIWLITDNCSCVFVCCTDALLIRWLRVGSVFVSSLYPSYHLEQYFHDVNDCFLSVFCKWMNKEVSLPFLGTHNGFLILGVPRADSSHSCYLWGSWVIWSHSCYRLPLLSGWLGLCSLKMLLLLESLSMLPSLPMGNDL